MDSFQIFNASINIYQDISQENYATVKASIQRISEAFSNICDNKPSESHVFIRKLGGPTVFSMVYDSTRKNSPYAFFHHLNSNDFFIAERLDNLPRLLEYDKICKIVGKMPLFDNISKLSYTDKLGEKHTDIEALFEPMNIREAMDKVDAVIKIISHDDYD